MSRFLVLMQNIEGDVSDLLVNVDHILYAHRHDNVDKDKKDIDAPRTTICVVGDIRFHVTIDFDELSAWLA